MKLHYLCWHTTSPHNMYLVDFLRIISNNDQNLALIQIEMHVLRAMGQVTHAAKKKILDEMSPDDFAAVGCKNPDIWVVGHSNSQVILTRPKTIGKGKKHITDVMAAKVLGDDWKKHINPLKMVTTTRMRQFLDDYENGLTNGISPYADQTIIFVRKSKTDWDVLSFDNP